MIQKSSSGYESDLYIFCWICKEQKLINCCHIRLHAFESYVTARQLSRYEFVVKSEIKRLYGVDCAYMSKRLRESAR